MFLLRIQNIDFQYSKFYTFIEINLKNRMIFLHF